MKLSLAWINDYLVNPVKCSSQELSQLVSVRIAEVDKVYEPHPVLESATCVEIKNIKKHPNADKLNLVTVSDGKQEVEVVCGAGNVSVGLRVPFVSEGCVLPSGMVIKKAKIRGVESSGMLCSGQELGLADTEGLLVLDGVDVGAKLSTLPRFQDVILEIDNKSLTHRPDLWGHYGFAREFAVIFGTKLKPLKLAEFKNEAKFPLKINIESNSCNAYMGVHVTNVNPNLATPLKIKNFLESVGQRSISLSVDLTNFVLLELGQPLHAFDGATWKGSNIFIRNAFDGEICVTLDNVERKLTKEDMVIADDKTATALAGVMGGAHHSITASTKEIILEAANFKADAIRRTSTRHNLRSDSSVRFEKTLHPELIELGAKRFCSLLQEIDSGCVISSFASEYKKHSQALNITTSWAYLEKKLGTKLDQQKVKNIFDGLDFSVQYSGDEIKLVIPGFRSFKDIEGAHDIVEEVGRHIGFDNILPKAPELPVIIPGNVNSRNLKYDFKNRLAGLGYSEVFTYPMVSKEECTKYKVASPTIEIKNPMGFEYMRNSLLISMLKAAEFNSKHEDDYDFFELGRIYTENGEDEILALVSTKSSYDFFTDLRSLQPNLRLERSNSVTHFHPFVQFNCFLKGEIGFGGRILPSLAKELRLNENTHFGFLKFNDLINIDSIKFKAPSRFPPVFFEVAIVTSKSTDSIEPWKVIKGSFDVIEEVHVVDEYYFDHNDQKSLAFKIKFQKSDATLEPAEIEKMQTSLISNLQRAGFNLRT